MGKNEIRGGQAALSQSCLGPAGDIPQKNHLEKPSGKYAGIMLFFLEWQKGARGIY